MWLDDGGHSTAIHRAWHFNAGEDKRDVVCEAQDKHRVERSKRLIQDHRRSHSRFFRRTSFESGKGEPLISADAGLEWRGFCMVFVEVAK
jgi:hypothetical protein